MAVIGTPPVVTAPPGLGPWMRWAESALAAINPRSSATPVGSPYASTTPISLRADSLKPGSVSSDVSFVAATITGSVIQSSPANSGVSRWWGDQNGISFSDPAGNVTINFDASTGKALITGEFQTSTTFPNAVLKTTDPVTFPITMGYEIETDQTIGLFLNQDAFVTGSLALYYTHIDNSSGGYDYYTYSLDVSKKNPDGSVLSTSIVMSPDGGIHNAGRIALQLGQTYIFLDGAGSSSGEIMMNSENGGSFDVSGGVSGGGYEVKLVAGVVGTGNKKGGLWIGDVYATGASTYDVDKYSVLYGKDTAIVGTNVRLQSANTSLYNGYDAPRTDVLVASAGAVAVTGNMTVSGSLTVGSFSSPASVPPGGMLMFTSNTPPSGWLVCDGSAVSRTTYAALFSAISTVYGAGDGSSTFNLPDFRTRVPAGYLSTDPNFTVVGKTGGAATVAGAAHTHTSAAHTHTSAAHTHTLSDAGQAAIALSSSAAAIVSRRVTSAAWTATLSQAVSAAAVSNTTSNSVGAGLTGSTDSATPGVTGSTTPGATGSTTPTATSVLQPYLTVIFIIKT